MCLEMAECRHLELYVFGSEGVSLCHPCEMKVNKFIENACHSSLESKRDMATKRKKLEKLWFIYGNNGPKHTHANHRFIQCWLEEGTDERAFFGPTEECIKAVDKVLGEK